MEGNFFVRFEDPFWVGLFERYDEQGYSFARYVFGAEPGDAELLAFALSLIIGNPLKFSQPLACDAKIKIAPNYKRRQRELRKWVDTEPQRQGTRAQQAMQAERERLKGQRQEDEKLALERYRQAKYQIDQERKKAKHRGR